MTRSGQPRFGSRKIPAALVDLGLVTVPTAIAVAASQERFRFLRDVDGPRFEPSDQARIDQIDRGFSRALELGDSLYILSGSGWWLSLGILVTSTIAAYVVVPALCKQRTPGQLLMGIDPVTVQEPEIIVSIDLSESGTRDSASDEHAHQVPSAVSAPATNNAVDMVDVTDSAEIADVVDVVDVVDPTVDVDIDELEAIGRAVELDRSDEREDDQVDITDGARFGPITLADESDYDQWDRDNTSPNDLRQSATIAPASAFEQLAMPESSLSESPLTAATLPDSRADQPRKVEAKPSQQRRQSDSAVPVWNESWNSWLYWDQDQERWFRHNTDTGRWQSLS